MQPCRHRWKVVKAIPGLFGAICFQAIVGADGPVVLEINARFGGGFPVTHRAGARFTQWLLNWLRIAVVDLRRMGRMVYGVAL